MKTSASLVDSCINRFIQSLFVDQDWDTLQSLLDENIRWHSAEAGTVFTDKEAIHEHIQQQRRRHSELLVQTTAPVCSQLDDRYQFITVKVLMQGENWHTLYLSLIQDCGSGLFCFVQAAPAQSSLNSLQHQELTLTFLPDQMPGGIFHCLFDEPLTLLQTSDSFLQLTGYTREEISTQLNNSFRALIDPRDYENTLKEVQEQLSHGSDKELQFRLLRKDKKPIWVLDKGRYLQDEWGRQYFCCILVDITETKKIQEELRLSLERYEIIMKQTRDIIFEWNLATDQLSFSDNWQHRLGYEPPATTAMILSKSKLHLLDEHRNLFVSLRDQILQGQPVLEGEMQLLDWEYQPIWYRVRITTQFDALGHPVKAIGILTDIDEEKYKSQLLLDKAQKDALTQYYNKETVQRLIEDWLAQYPKAFNALMIIDIDDFKHVNDTLGHLFGDAFLIEVTSRIHQLFRSEDILGRIGGDEFLIFLKNIPGPSLAERKAQEILEAFRTFEIRNQKIANVSCSIGIALTTDSRLSYHQLFQRADQALYSIKNQGKNRYAFYSELLRSETFPLRDGMTAVNTRIDSDTNQKNAYTQVSDYVFSTLYNTQNLEECIEHILEVVGLHFNVSRVYIFENSEDDRFCSNTFEWCNAGILPEKDALQRVSYEEDLNGNYLDNFDENGIFYCPDIMTLDPKHIEILEPQHIKSLLQCAIQDQGVIKGYIGFDECQEKRLWDQDQIDVLTHVAEILSVFLLKRRAEKRIESLQAQLSQSESTRR